MKIYFNKEKASKVAEYYSKLCGQSFILILDLFILELYIIMPPDNIIIFYEKDNK